MAQLRTFISLFFLLFPHLLASPLYAAEHGHYHDSAHFVIVPFTASSASEDVQKLISYLKNQLVDENSEEEDIEAQDLSSSELELEDEPKKLCYKENNVDPDQYELAKALQQYFNAKKIAYFQINARKGKDNIPHVKFEFVNQRSFDPEFLSLLEKVGASRLVLPLSEIQKSELQRTSKEIKGCLARFKRSIRDKEHLLTLLHGIEKSGVLTFDHLVQCVAASTIALTGLATNQSMAIVASMLISPMLGPILASTLGAAAKKGHLVKMGLTTTALDLLICMTVGFFGGLIASTVMDENQWPTDEMLGRGFLKSFYNGVPIAIASGLSLGTSALSRNQEAAIGAGISLSLLPPAVNGGLLLAYSATVNQHPNNLYFTHDAELASMAGWSFLISSVNILCVYIFGYGMFVIKGV